MRLRVLALPAGGLAAVLAGVLTLGGLNGNLVYYLTPGEAVAQRVDAAPGQRFRLGGLVEKGSVERTPDSVRFSVVDALGGPSVQVVHSGAPNQLFQEGIGVVVEGVWTGDVFTSDTMIIKHDEEYRAPEAGSVGAAP